MTSLTAYLRYLVSDETALYECRNCGATVEADQPDCPACGSDEIAEYQFLD